MVRTLCFVGVVLMLAACAPTTMPAPPLPVGHEPAEEAAVLDAMDRYLSTLSANNIDGLAALQAPEGMTYRAQQDASGAWTVVPRPASFWLDPVNDQGVTLRERYWSPTVLVHGPVAVTWAPYEFWVNGETVHCGIHVFNFVKLEGRWKVANSAWTVEPRSCAALRPTDGQALRPADN